MLTNAGSDEPSCPYSVSFMKHYHSFSIIFNVILGSFSVSGKVHSVIIFDILEHPKIVKSRLK